MGLGLPVVVSDLECFRDFISNGKNGLVFSHKQKDAFVALAACITKLLGNADVYNEFSKNAMSTAQDFSVAAIAEEYLCLLNNLLLFRSSGFDEKEMKVKEIK